MAEVTGEAAKSVSEQATKKSLKLVLLLYLFGITVGIVLGLLLGYVIGAYGEGLYAIYITLASIVVLSFLWIYFSKKIRLVEDERDFYRKGMIGETIIGQVLKTLPEDYKVINDVTTGLGNLDHVVVGPTGVYVIDVKNWRGVVTANGKGELLLNGKPTDKPEVKNLTRSVTDVRDKIKTLSKLDPYIKGVLAFCSARVDARWRSTGAIHCVTDEKLYDYIVEGKNGNKLKEDEIESISQAFVALKGMNEDSHSKELDSRSGRE